jgi:hypothetical protein
MAANISLLSSQIVRQIMDDIKEKKFNIISVMSLISKIMEIVEKIPNLSGKYKKECVISVLNEIAKGIDGIEGTEDDLIPGYIMKGLKFMLNNKIAENVIDTVVSASKGLLNVNTISDGTTPICFGIFATCIGK